MLQLDFDAFYEFAFPRVYRFASKRCRDKPTSEALCRLILERAVTDLAAHDDAAVRPGSQSTEMGMWLFALAKRVAADVEATPELLARAPRTEDAS